ncbi:hypothetical protein HMPREF1608_02374 [Escherichia coli 908525]|nr:hypothetical protein HMPREF1608_02374 [Escherichia coli 908525]
MGRITRRRSTCNLKYDEYSHYFWCLLRHRKRVAVFVPLSFTASAMCAGGGVKRSRSTAPGSLHYVYPSASDCVIISDL